LEPGEVTGRIFGRHKQLTAAPLWTLFGTAAAFGLWGKAKRRSLGGAT
jgi:hypothetical protein